jgi:hypothetical protein
VAGAGPDARADKTSFVGFLQRLAWRYCELLILLECPLLLVSISLKEKESKD